MTKIQPKPKVIAYIDGFNLYYALKGLKGYKWLNLKLLLENLFPEYEITKVKYFTASVSERPNSKHPGSHARQQVYWRALRTVPEIEFILGNFQTRATRLPIEPPPTTGPRTVQVLRTEEKGSDVNLAVELVIDAFRGAFDEAIIVSNDSDLERALNYVRQVLGKPLYLAICSPTPSLSVKAACGERFRQIRTHYLASSQFPQKMTLSTGKTLECPPDWVTVAVAPTSSIPKKRKKKRSKKPKPEESSTS